MDTIKEIPVVVWGAGGVGRALLQQLRQYETGLAARSGLHFRVVGLADSQRWHFARDGLTHEAISEILTAKLRQKTKPLPAGSRGEQAVAKRRRAIDELKERASRPSPLAMLEQVRAAALGRVMLVDVTAASGLEEALLMALKWGYALVLANKKPLAGAWAQARPFYDHRLVRHEATVGGGQPVVATMRYLRDIHDEVLAIGGQLSGTMGYLCGQMDERVPFSQALAEARLKGYTEPDPREDLSGADVRRKLLILGRMAGWPLEAAQIEVESLVPTALAHLPTAEFMQAAVALDAGLQERVDRAGASGEVLRYTAVVTREGGEVGLKAVPSEGNYVNLKHISYRTRLYDDEPLTLSGKGAGVAMTAGGVLGDMVALGRAWSRF